MRSVVSILLFACLNLADLVATSGDARSLRSLKTPSFSGFSHIAPSTGFRDVQPGRRLAQSASQACYWNEGDEKCLVHPSTTLSILQQSDNAFAQLVIRESDCLIRGTTSDMCNAMTGCDWLPTVEVCIFDDYAAAYSESPCTIPAAELLRFDGLFVKCTAEKNEKACNSLHGCFWDRGGQSCYGDLTTAFGYENAHVFLEEYNEIYWAKNRTLRDAPWSELEDLALVRDWEAMLHFELPASPCPDGQDERMCDVVDADTNLLLPAEAYCSSRYERSLDAGDCNADTLCAYDCDAGCSVGKRAVVEFFRRALENMFDLLPKGTDEQLFAEALVCSNILNPVECRRRETCRWMYPLEMCALSREYTAKRLLKNVSAKTTDPFCLLQRVVLQSGCYRHATEDACSKTEGCGWLPFLRECQASGDTLIAAVVAADPSLEPLLREKTTLCSSLKSWSACYYA